MFNIIKHQYQDTQSAIKYKNFHSDFFSITRGVKQGDSMSPTLFNIFINDMHAEFINKDNDPLKIINSKLGCLLFADDLLILSETKAGLQNSLNNLEKYCFKWQLTLNVKKTKTMIFRQRISKNDSPFIKYKNEFIENVIEYKFLGILIKSNGNLSYSAEDLSKKAWKVLFSIKSYMGSLKSIPIKVACNLFDNMVRPIVTYNAEITFMDTYITYYRAYNRAKKSGKEINTLQIIDKNPLEKLHLKFCKFILGTNKSSSNLAVKSELNRLPIEHYIKIQSLKYLMRIQSQNLNPLIHECFELNKDLDKEGYYNWFTYAKNIAKETDIDTSCLENVSFQNTISTEKMIKTKIVQSYNKLHNDKFERINENNKLYLYKHLKNENNNNACYLSYCKSFIKRQQITKLRISDHSLLIEKGRYLKIPRENRICSFCNKLEDETHFLLHCSKYFEIRKEFINSLKQDHIDFENLTDLEKVKLILTPSTPKQVEKLSSYLTQSLELRTGD